jgi:hypothetical protein
MPDFAPRGVLPSRSTSPRRGWLIRVGAWRLALVAAVLALTVTVEYTFVPAYGSQDDLRGRVTGVTPSQFATVTYIQVPDGGLWTKPTFYEPVTPLASDGTFVVDVTTGGSDAQAGYYVTYVIPVGYAPATMSGQTEIPTELEQRAVAVTGVTRPRPTDRTISFSGSDFIVKKSDTPVGPGPNYFSDSSDNVFVDGAGQLHLKLTHQGSRWTSAEVLSVKDFGYGSYCFSLAGLPATLDPRVVVGLFTWNNLPSYTNRELDVEVGTWNDGGPPLQYVVQPYTVAGNRFRFPGPISEPLRHCFDWRPALVAFRSSDQAGNVFQTFNYTGLIPPPSAGVRFNVWLLDGIAPSNNAEVEVVVQRFEFQPAGAAPTPPSPSTPTPTPTTPAPLVCSLRPNVGVQTSRVGAGLLRATITVGTNAAVPTNHLRELRLGQMVNGVVDTGTLIGSPTSVTMPAGTTQTSFLVRRTAPGYVTVPFEVVDDCGPWKTLVGGGPNAF